MKKEVVKIIVEISEIESNEIRLKLKYFFKIW